MSKYLLNLVFVLVGVFAVSCATTAAPVAEIVQNDVIAAQEDVFDPDNVSTDYYELTMAEVRAFMDEFNGIIRRSDYNAWVSILSPEYYAELSSPEHLQRASETPAMVSRGITIRTLRDFFINVVVPSRANSRVDDIEFIDVNRVKAFTVNTNRAGEVIQRIRLFDLGKIDGKWLIIN